MLLKNKLLIGLQVKMKYRNEREMREKERERWEGK